MASHRLGGIDEAESGSDSSGDHLCDRCDLQLFPVVQYIKQYDDRLDGGRFSAIELAGDVRKIRDVRTAYT